MKDLKLYQIRGRLRKKCKRVVAFIRGVDELFPEIEHLFVQRIENKCLAFDVVLYFPQVFVDYQKREFGDRLLIMTRRSFF